MSRQSERYQAKGMNLGNRTPREFVGRSRSGRIQSHLNNLACADDEIARSAERNLIRYYGCRAVDGLIAACSHPEPRVRFRAVYALGHTRESRAFEIIARLTRDEHPHVRYDATIALGILGDARALPLLLELQGTEDPDHAQDSAAAIALARMARKKLAD